MSSYIKSGVMSKQLLERFYVKRVETKEMSILADEACLLDEMVDEYRKSGRYDTRVLNDEMRSVRLKASALWKKYYDIDAVVNEKYHDWYNLSFEDWIKKYE